MDSKSNRGPQDRARINVNEDYELQYWCQQLGISREELKQAVAKVGVSADAVKQYIKGGNR